MQNWNPRVISFFRGRYYFLSNFYVTSVNYMGIGYASAEHAYQAAKTISHVDHENIKWAATPGEAKKWGKRIQVREDWNQVRLSVMQGILEAKFSKPELARRLIATGDALLIEGNPWGDTFWGECPIGTGSNHLGKLLTHIREKLKESEHVADDCIAGD